MLADRQVPEMVKETILDHWQDKWWKFMGFDLSLMETLSDRLDVATTERFRKMVADFDTRAEKREKAREAREEREDREYKKVDIACSFCGKAHKEVDKIIAGPSVYICNECVALCQDIMEHDRADRAAKREELAGPQAIETEEQHEAALAEIGRLMTVQGPDGQERLKELSALVESYEKEHFPIAKPTPEEALQLRLEQAEARVKALEGEVEALQYEAKEGYPEDDET